MSQALHPVYLRPTARRRHPLAADYLPCRPAGQHAIGGSTGTSEQEAERLTEEEEGMRGGKSAGDEAIGGNRREDVESEPPLRRSGVDPGRGPLVKSPASSGSSPPASAP